MDSKHPIPLIDSDALQQTDSGYVEFKFVISDQRTPSNTRTIRSHVMRQSWQQRKKQKPGKVVPSTRILAPKDIHTTGTVNVEGVQADDTYSTPSEMDPISYSYLQMPPPPDSSANEDWDSTFNNGQSGNTNGTESLLACWENQDHNSDTRCSGIPANPSPWDVLVSTMVMDTFATFPVQFFPEYQDLIYYCKFPINHLPSMSTILNNSLTLSKRAWFIS